MLQGYYCDDSEVMFSNDDNDPKFNEWVDYGEAAELQAENERFRKALEKLAKLGNEPHLGSSDGNRIAQQALRAK